MGVHRNGGIVGRITGALLLAQLPFVLAGSLALHHEHPAGQIATPVFADAAHGGLAAHWEAAETVRLRQCAACLLPAQPLEPPATDSVGHLQAEAERAPLPASTGLPTSGAGRSQRSRAPPPSGLA